VSGGATCQWYHNRVAVDGANDSTFEFFAGMADAGAYRVVVTDSRGLATSVDAGALTVQSHAWLANLSTRARVGIGDDALIAGFYTNAPAGDTGKTLLVRGIGPTLAEVPFNVPDALAGGSIEVFDAGGVSIDAADSWAPELATEFARLGAFALPGGSRDAALREVFAPGAHTATVALRPADGVPGVGLIELYDADAGAPDHRLVNLSARARTSGGANAMFGGFVIHGTSHQTVLVRAVGIGLRLFLDDSLLQPVLTLHDVDGRVIATNRGRLVAAKRGDSPVNAGVGLATNRVMHDAGAFLLPMPQMSGYDAGWDCALVLTLPPGNYTAEVSGDAGASGVALVEIFEVP
jgi:hypothetical protein